MTTVGKLVGDSHEDEAVQITRSSSNQTQRALSIHMQALLLCQSINQSINQSKGITTASVGAETDMGGGGPGCPGGE